MCLCLFFPNPKLFHPGVLILTVWMQVDKEYVTSGSQIQFTEQDTVGVEVSATHQETAGHLCQDCQTIELVQVWKATL